MATSDQVLQIAAGEIGYYAPSDPAPGSKYGRWMAEVTGEEWLAGPSTSIWWCCCFVSWVLAQANQSVPGFPSYNTDLVLAARPPMVPVSQAKPGDIVIWDWDGNGATDHIGFIESYDGGRMITIEGNKDNAVKRVDRTDVRYLIRAVIRPAYASTSTPNPSPNPGSAIRDLARLVIDGRYGNYPERVNRLYDEVQGCVDSIAFGADVSRYPQAVIDVADEVMNGDYGNYPARKWNLYNTVQDVVNSIA